MNEHKEPGMSLDEIMREFSDAPQPEAPEEEISQASLDEIEVEAELSLDFEIPQDFFEDKLLAVQEEESDTIRLEDADLSNIAAQYAPAAEEPTQVLPVVEDAEEAPATEEDAPPLVLHPQSSPAKALKKQLVAGPERRYYLMAEKGTGKLQGAIFVNFIITVLCAVATTLQAFGFVGQSSMRMMVFGQILAMLVSALLGSFQLIEGAADLVKGRFSLNTLLGITFVVCGIDGFFCLRQLRIPCCAAFCLAMTFSQLSTYHRRSTILSQLDTLRKASHIYGTCVQEQEDGSKIFLPTEGKVDDYMDNYLSQGLADKVQRIYAYCALGVSFALGITAVFLKNVPTGFQVFAVSLLAAIPAASFICTTRPLAILQRRLHKLGTVLCGWQGIHGSTGKATYPITFEDLFPKDTTQMNGVKFYGSRTPEQIVAYANALMQATQSGLAPLFAQLVENHNAPLYDADDLQAFEHGVGGQVQGVTVLAGSLSFLKEMGVEVEESQRISQSVCVSIDGELSGIFAITYKTTKASSAGIHTLTSYMGLTVCVAAADPMLTASFLNSKFHIQTGRLVFPDYPTRQDLRHARGDGQSCALFLTTKPGLAPAAYGVTGARATHTATMLGLIVQIVGGAVGLGIMALLTVLGAFYLLTPVNMFLYQLIWLIPGLLITEWTRSI